MLTMVMMVQTNFFWPPTTVASKYVKALPQNENSVINHLPPWSFQTHKIFFSLRNTI